MRLLRWINKWPFFFCFQLLELIRSASNPSPHPKKRKFISTYTNPPTPQLGVTSFLFWRLCLNSTQSVCNTYSLIVLLTDGWVYTSEGGGEACWVMNVLRSYGRDREADTIYIHDVGMGGQLALLQTNEINFRLKYVFILEFHRVQKKFCIL